MFMCGGSADKAGGIRLTKRRPAQQSPARPLPTATNCPGRIQNPALTTDLDPAPWVSSTAGKHSH